MMTNPIVATCGSSFQPPPVIPGWRVQLVDWPRAPARGEHGTVRVIGFQTTTSEDIGIAGGAEQIDQPRSGTTMPENKASSRMSEGPVGGV